MSDRALTPKEIAERYGVSDGTVGHWIRSGELRAINCGRVLGKKKPRWKILPEALAAFELSRTVSPLPAPVRRRKSAVIEFIK
jgi:excisionase family DNA binding protein